MASSTPRSAAGPTSVSGRVRPSSAERRQQPGQAVDVVAVEVRDADGVEAVAAEVRLHEPADGPLAAVEQHDAAVAADGRRGEVAGGGREGGVRSRAGRRRAQCAGGGRPYSPAARRVRAAVVQAFSWRRRGA